MHIVDFFKFISNDLFLTFIIIFFILFFTLLDIYLVDRLKELYFKSKKAIKSDKYLQFFYTFILLVIISFIRFYVLYIIMSN